MVATLLASIIIISGIGIIVSSSSNNMWHDHKDHAISHLVVPLGLVSWAHRYGHEQ